MVGSPFTQEQVKEWFEYRSGKVLTRKVRKIKYYRELKC